MMLVTQIETFAYPIDVMCFARVVALQRQQIEVTGIPLGNNVPQPLSHTYCQSRKPCTSLGPFLLT